ncbi:conserved protein of unknown function [Tenacibaculum soleae]
MYFIFHKILRQVTVTMNNMNTVPYNSQISDCGTIDLESYDELRIQFTVNLSKQQNMVVSSGTIQTYYKKSSSSQKQDIGTPYNVPANFGTFFAAPFDLDLQAIDFDVSGGTFFVEYKHSSSTLTYTPNCSYSVEKDQVPTFTMPTSTTVSCNSSSPKTFTVTNVNNSPGNLSFSWEVGSGWERNGIPVSNFTTTTNGISLVPTSFPPSNVRVTPVLDGISYPKLSTNVSLSNFNPTNEISGENAFCNISNTIYSVNNLPNGTTISSWTSSNTNIVTVSPINNYQASVTKVGNGAATITAIIENSCGQQKTIIKQIWTGGKPQFTFKELPLGTNYLQISMVGTNGTNINNQGITSTSWQKISESGGCTSSIYNNNYDMFNGTVNGNCSNWYLNAKITATNSCGTTTLYRSFTPPIPDPCDDNYRFAQNPMKSGNVVNRIIIDPCDNNFSRNSLKKTVSYTIDIHNNYGEKVYSKTQSGIDFNISSLKKGFYIVTFQTTSGKIISKKLIIE